MPVAAISVLWMSFMSVVFLFPSLPQTDVADMNYTVVVMGGTLLLSLAWYYFPKYGGVHWFTGPVRNIDSKGSSSTSGKRDKDGIAAKLHDHTEPGGEKSDY
jgi:LPXTG-motif cell wall-anchored protein